jgi:hypothetical protein
MVPVVSMTRRYPHLGTRKEGKVVLSKPSPSFNLPKTNGIERFLIVVSFLVLWETSRS